MAERVDDRDIILISEVKTWGIQGIWASSLLVFSEVWEFSLLVVLFFGGVPFMLK